VQAATAVSGIITNDTTWTKNGSPYTLTGNTLIEEGVTLTIEAGATVDLNDYYIMVTGILITKGASDDKIYFHDGSIHFSSNVAWDEESGTVVCWTIVTTSLYRFCISWLIGSK
jgi:hypothetical protein